MAGTQAADGIMVDVQHLRKAFGSVVALNDATLTVRQGETTVARRRLPWPASPGRVFRLPSALLAGARPENGPVTIDVT